MALSNFSTPLKMIYLFLLFSNKMKTFSFCNKFNSKQKRSEEFQILKNKLIFYNYVTPDGAIRYFKGGKSFNKKKCYITTSVIR